MTRRFTESTIEDAALFVAAGLETNDSAVKVLGDETVRTTERPRPALAVFPTPFPCSVSVSVSRRV